MAVYALKKHDIKKKKKSNSIYASAFIVLRKYRYVGLYVSTNKLIYKQE